MQLRSTALKRLGSFLTATSLVFANFMFASPLKANAATAVNDSYFMNGEPDIYMEGDAPTRANRFSTADTVDGGGINPRKIEFLKPNPAGELGGRGTADEPHLIMDVNDFLIFATEDKYREDGVYVKLMGDLDFSSMCGQLEARRDGENTPKGTRFFIKGTSGLSGNATNGYKLKLFKPIADFAGTFDGQGYTIKGLTVYHFSEDVNNPASDAGLFATCDGILKNLHFDDSIVLGCAHFDKDDEILYCGALVGYLARYNGGAFDDKVVNCSSNASVYACSLGDGVAAYKNVYAGGLVGGFEGADTGSGVHVITSYFAGNVYAKGKVVKAGYIIAHPFDVASDCYRLNSAGDCNVYACKHGGSDAKMFTLGDRYVATNAPTEDNDYIRSASLTEFQNGCVARRLNDEAIGFGATGDMFIWRQEIGKDAWPRASGERHWQTEQNDTSEVNNTKYVGKGKVFFLSMRMSDGQNENECEAYSNEPAVLPIFGTNELDLTYADRLLPNSLCFDLTNMSQKDQLMNGTYTASVNNNLKSILLCAGLYDPEEVKGAVADLTYNWKDENGKEIGKTQELKVDPAYADQTLETSCVYNLKIGGEKLPSSFTVDETVTIAPVFAETLGEENEITDDEPEESEAVPTGDESILMTVSLCAITISAASVMFILNRKSKTVKSDN